MSMFLTQTGGILLDAYRDMNSRKMFWIVIILSACAVAVFALFGTHDRSLTFLWMTSPPMDNADQAQIWYKWGFSFFFIGIYLTWIAAVLALISTAGIFPDLMTGGSIDLYLSKPIGRTRLFLTKYFSGLMFVTMQVAVFTVGSFLVLGIRGHSWEPGLFLAIPIVVLFFSYLYGICVLIGVMTRSTIAALLLTLLAWFFIFAVDYVDKKVSEFAVAVPMMHRQAQFRLKQIDARIAQLESEPPATTQATTAEAPPPRSGIVVSRGRPPISSESLADLRSEREIYAREAAEPEKSPTLENVQTAIVVIKTFVPKTRETTNLLDRYLMPDSQINQAAANVNAEADERGNTKDMMEMMDPTRGRSIWWVVGTSLAFEAACVGLAAWIFKRRDF